MNSTLLQNCLGSYLYSGNFCDNEKTRKYVWLVVFLAKSLKTKFDEHSFFLSARLTSFESIRASWVTFLPFPCLHQSILTEHQGKHCLNYNDTVTLFSKLELDVYLKPKRFMETHKAYKNSPAELQTVCPFFRYPRFGPFSFTQSLLADDGAPVFLNIIFSL